METVESNTSSTRDRSQINIKTTHAPRSGDRIIASRAGVAGVRRPRRFESVNAALKGVFTDLGRGFLRVMGVTKMTVLLGFTLAAFNLDRIRSFRAKHALDEQGRPTEKPKQTRAKRRTGTWAGVIEPTTSPPD